MDLCVALDRASLKENLSLVKEIREFPVWIKIGLRSFIRDGWKIVDEVRQIAPDLKIFLDLKLYDIPNTMADAGEEIALKGVDMFNIHTSSGKRAMLEVMKRLEKFEKRPLVLGVTALTSFSEDEFHEVYSSSTLESGIHLANLGFQAGLDGVVSSVWESRAIKTETNRDFITLTPGIRPFGESSDDQRRVGNIETAKDELVDFIVIGRPIYKSNEPKRVVERILHKIESLAY